MADRNKRGWEQIRDLLVHDRYVMIYLLIGTALAGRYMVNAGDGAWRRVVMSAGFIILTVIAVYDRKTMRIPDSLNVALLAVGIGDWVIGGMPGLSERLCGFFCVSLILLLVSAVSGNGIGGGDIKLMAAAGFVLGPEKVVAASLIGFLSAGLYSMVLMLMKKMSLKDYFPFGPFLCLGIGWAMGW